MSPVRCMDSGVQSRQQMGEYSRPLVGKGCLLITRALKTARPGHWLWALPASAAHCAVPYAPLKTMCVCVCACPIPNVTHSYPHLTREGLLVLLPQEETEALNEWHPGGSSVTRIGKPHSVHPLYTCFLALYCVCTCTVFRWRSWYAEVTMTNKLHTPYFCKTFTIYTFSWSSLAAQQR